MSARRTSRRSKGWAITTLGGIGAALAILSTPIGLLEMIVASLGISEIVPAAAPPLGLKARALLALFAALMTAAIVAVTRRESGTKVQRPDQQEHKTSAPGAKTMGFAFSKLAALARSRTPLSPDRPDRDLPSLRRADAHPDAPARAPIFASRDFGGLDIFARTEPGRRELVVNAEPEREPLVPAAGLAMPSAPAPLPEAALPQPAPAPIPPEPAFAPVAAPPSFVPAPVRAIHVTPTRAAYDLSLSELTERFERGLALRRHAPETAPAHISQVLASIPPAMAVPVRPAVADDVDEALRAALGTLRSMAGRAR